MTDDIHLPEQPEQPNPPTVISTPQKPETVSGLIQSIKKQITDYMLENHNITWLDDETERRLYDILLGATIAVATPYIYKYFMP